MGRRYKTLLPAPQGPPGPSDPGEPSPPATKRKRMYVKTACDICRIKKTACDGHRPSCTPCKKRKSPCTFSGRAAGSDESRSPGTANISTEADSASIVTALLTAHDAEAHELLDRMRQGRGTLEVLGQWSEEEEADTGLTLLAPDQTSVEFELMIRHPIAYPALVPLDSHSLNASASDRLQMAHDPAATSGETTPNEEELPDAESPGPSGYATYEARIRQVHFAKWTDNPVSGSEAASAIANYLAHDHVLLHLFDAELFLKDLTNSDGDDEWCSSLLMNALLAWSLPGIMTSSEDFTAQANLAFETALHQLGTQQEEAPSLTTLAAMELLALSALFRGQGAASSSLLRECLLMGQRLSLFSDGNDPAYNEKTPSTYSVEDAARATASWGMFSLATMLSLHCQRNELSPSLTPAYALPEFEEPDLPFGTLAMPRYSSSLWKLIHEINSHYYGGSGNFSNEVTVSFVRNMLERLLQWADGLPVVLTRGNRSTQEIMILHVYFHAALMTLLHPLALRRDASPLFQGESLDRSAEAIYSASAAQMHRLLDIQHSRPSGSTSSVFWHTSLLFSANASVRSSGNGMPLRRRRFLRAMDGFADLHMRYPVMRVIFRGLMTMAVDVGLVGGPEAVRLARRLGTGAGSSGLGAGAGEQTEACFIVDLELALVDRGLAHVDSLSRRFDEIVMFDEFTTMGP